MKQILKDGFLWGFALWAIGYVLGIVLFMAVPAALIGWMLTPIGTVIALWVLFKKIHGASFVHYAAIALVWSVIAIVCDYLFLVLLFKPADGYYKPDVYLYYALTFLLPIAVGYWKLRGNVVPVEPSL
jgi:hypothetical protein